MAHKMTEEARALLERHRERKRMERSSPTGWNHYVATAPPPPTEAPPPEIGDRKTFVPAAFFNCISDINGILHRPVTGRVVYVHEAHRWYRVEFPLGDRGAVGHECFKF